MPEALRTQADAYITALIIFAAPVIALEEFLAKYRVHGANLFHMGEGKPARNHIEHRMAMRAILSAEIRAWLERNGHDLASPDLKAYLKQWTKAQEMDSFALRKPSRWNYFRHLIEYPRIYGRIRSTRHRLYSYVRAFGALLLGYDQLHLLDDFRKGFKDVFGKPLRESVFSESKRAAAAKNS